MSEDDRMERARRIRRMREGDRAEADDSASERESGSDDDGATVADDDRANEADDGGADSSADPADESSAEPAATDDDRADESPSSEPSQTNASEQSQDTTMNETSPPTETDEPTTDSDDDAPDPEAVAQRAAEAAASMSGGDETATQSGQGAEDDGAMSGGAAAAMQGSVSAELPDQEQLDAAMGKTAVGEETGGAEESDEHAAPTPSSVDTQSTSEQSTRVLEFTLGDEHYCIDISMVEEIVKRDSITRVPNTDQCIEGVVDLRGQITTILDPKSLLGIDQDGSEELMIVFDPEAFDDQGAIGWIVDEVRQVSPIRESEVSDPPVDDDYIRGVVDREDEEFVIWTKPSVAIELATVDESED